MVFNVAGPMAATPVAANGALARFEWSTLVGSPDTLELIVQMSMNDAEVHLVSGSGPMAVESNRVRVDRHGAGSAEPPKVPDLLPWIGSGSNPRVMIAGERFDSGRIVDASGAEAPPGSYRCERTRFPSLASFGMECEIFRRQPLEATGFVGKQVRAIVDSSMGPVLTRAVDLPQ